MQTQTHEQYIESVVRQIAKLTPMRHAEVQLCMAMQVRDAMAESGINETTAFSIVDVANQAIAHWMRIRAHAEPFIPRDEEEAEPVSMAARDAGEPEMPPVHVGQATSN